MHTANLARISRSKPAIQKIVRHPLLGWLGKNLDWLITSRMLHWCLCFIFSLREIARLQQNYITIMNLLVLAKLGITVT